VENLVERNVVFAPHDDGGGAFAVLCRLARALVNVADENGYQLHLYFLNSSAVKGGQDRLNDLTRRSKSKHDAFFVPTNNLIWLPKNEKTAAVLGEQIPDILRKWVRPLWHSWPCEPHWIRPNLPIARAARRDLQKLIPQLWGNVALGISMGVPQLHRVARREVFPSVEVGDWFFSVGLRGCMQESFVPPDVIAATEPDLKMIEEDEFKALEVWLTLHQAPLEAYKAHVARSPVTFNIMDGALWSGDLLPPEGIENWHVARELRNEINTHLSGIRNVPSDRVGHIRVAYIVTGMTGVWGGIVDALKTTKKRVTEQVAVIDLDRGKGMITFLEDGGEEFVSTVLAQVAGEERHLATCRASDFGITRTAGGVLGFAETRRPSVLVDEPGHWLGRIQREQCHEAGLCVVIPLGRFLESLVDKSLENRGRIIQEQADRLGTNSDLDQTAITAANLPVGAERKLAEYLFEMYIA
jgi:hypothetical protein